MQEIKVNYQQIEAEDNEKLNRVFDVLFEVVEKEILKSSSKIDKSDEALNSPFLSVQMS